MHKWKNTRREEMYSRNEKRRPSLSTKVNGKRKSLTSTSRRNFSSATICLMAKEISLAEKLTPREILFYNSLRTSPKDESILLKLLLKHLRHFHKF